MFLLCTRFPKFLAWDRWPVAVIVLLGAVQAKLERFRFMCLLSFVAVGAWYVYAIRAYWSGLSCDAAEFYDGYLGVLVLLGFARKRLETRNSVLIRAAGNSQWYYILHYPVLVATAYVLMPHIQNVPMQIGTFIVVSLVLTVLLSELLCSVTPRPASSG